MATLQLSVSFVPKPVESYRFKNHDLVVFLVIFIPDWPPALLPSSNMGKERSRPASFNQDSLRQQTSTTDKAMLDR